MLKLLLISIFFCLEGCAPLFLQLAGGMAGGLMGSGIGAIGMSARRKPEYELTDEGTKVKVVDESQSKNCRFIGNIYGVFKNESDFQQNNLRNKAARSGGNSIRLIKETNDDPYQQVAHVFICN